MIYSSNDYRIFCIRYQCLTVSYEIHAPTGLQKQFLHFCAVTLIRHSFEDVGFSWGVKTQKYKDIYKFQTFPELHTKMEEWSVVFIHIFKAGYMNNMLKC